MLRRQLAPHRHLRLPCAQSVAIRSMAADAARDNREARAAARVGIRHAHTSCGGADATTRRCGHARGFGTRQGDVDECGRLPWAITLITTWTVTRRSNIQQESLCGNTGLISWLQDSLPQSRCLDLRHTCPVRAAPNRLRGLNLRW